MSLQELIDDCPNILVADAFLKCNDKLPRYRNIVCFVSGGADSDVMIDLITKVDTTRKVKYVFFNTGFEYRATLEHLDELEQKYGITIERRRAVKPIPLACKQYGVPFLSKYVSEMIYRLQKHNFKWEDKPFEELLIEYPRCRGALKWWCNKHIRRDGKIGTLNIDRDPYLKEYMIKNPPDFKISSKCCEWAKKKGGEIVVKEEGADLKLLGIRKSEGGIRSVKYKSCFTPGDVTDNYRPIYWFTNKIKKEYCDKYSVTNSRCYSEYGLTRTGCVGCPFNRDFETELQIVREFEPQLYNAVNNVFGKSHEYARKFREYQFKRESGIL